MILDRNIWRFGKILAAALVVLAAGSGRGFAQATTCGTTTWRLTAGQTIDVGTVAVSNDLSNLYVTYTLSYPGATFGTLHMWAGNNLLNLPATPNGIPVPGQFCNALGGNCHDATGLTTYTFTAPFSTLGIVDATTGCGTSLYVVTHAEVAMDSNGDETMEQETAFGGDTPGLGPRWWYYGLYNICCNFGPPTVPTYKTAFAKGGYVWTTDKKSNPEVLPSLRLTQNRWGWAILLTTPGITSYEVWAGAGLNKTSNGVHVGTLTVNWDGATAVVTYDMTPTYLLQEVHLYATDASPTTTAPGQYGYLDEFDPLGVATYTFTVPLADTNGTAGVWLIAHAVVSGTF